MEYKAKDLEESLELKIKESSSKYVDVVVGEILHRKKKKVMKYCLKKYE